MDYSNLIIDLQTSICDAMRIIDRSDLKILFVADGRKLVGSLTDGDIRRFLFNGGTLQDNAEKAANHNPRVAKSLKHTSELYNRLYYIAIPVIDQDGNITGIYVGEELQQKKQSPLHVPVVINAGGKGTRLDPLREFSPNP